MIVYFALFVIKLELIATLISVLMILIASYPQGQKYLSDIGLTNYLNQEYILKIYQFNKRNIIRLVISIALAFAYLYFSGVYNTLLSQQSQLIK